MVNIAIGNDGKFQDVALLVDKESCLKRIQELREILQIQLDPTKPAWRMPFSNKFFSQKLSLMSKYFLSEKQLREFRQWLNDDANFLPHLTNFPSYSFAQALEDASRKLLYEFKKTHNFLPAIKSAIATNTVTEKDYESYVFTEYAHNIADTSKLPRPDREKYRIPQEGKWLAIFFQPYTDIDDINNLLKKELKNYKIPKSRVSQNIKTYRNWYWLNKDKQYGYKKIAKQSAKLVSWGDVRYGIQAYTNLLLGVQK